MALIVSCKCLHDDGSGHLHSPRTGLWSAIFFKQCLTGASIITKSCGCTRSLMERSLFTSTQRQQLYYFHPFKRSTVLYIHKFIIVRLYMLGVILCNGVPIYRNKLQSIDTMQYVYYLQHAVIAVR